MRRLNSRLNRNPTRRLNLNLCPNPNPNPKLNLEESPFYVNTEARPWIHTEDEQPRRAAVSSFGFGGTNFHVVLEEYRQSEEGPHRLQQVHRCQQVRSVAAATHGVRVRVLEEQEVIIFDAAGRPRLPHGALEIKPFVVGNPAEPSDPQARIVWGHLSSWSQSHVSRFFRMRSRNSTAVEPSKAR